MKTVICTIFRCFGVKNRRKWKLCVVSSLNECTDLVSKLPWLICIVAANFIKISETIAEISHLTIFFKRQRPPSWISLNFFFWTTVMLWIGKMCHHAKFHQNWSNVGKDIVLYLNISLVWHENGYLQFSRCFGVKNRMKFKFFLIFE